MLSIAEYNTKNLRVEAKESRGIRWITIVFSGQELLLFFDTEEEFDAALRAFQGLTPPEIEVAPAPPVPEIASEIDDETPF